MSDSEPQKPRLRWLRWVGFGFFALAIVFAILAFLPNSSDTEPGWLARIPPTFSEVKVYENTMYPPGSGVRNDVQIVDRTRFVEMSFDEFVDKLNKDLRAEDGWKFSRPAATLTASWNKGGRTGSSTIWIIQEGSRIRVSSTFAHTLGWLDKAKRSVARLFGR